MWRLFNVRILCLFGSINKILLAIQNWKIFSYCFRAAKEKAKAKEAAKKAQKVNYMHYGSYELSLLKAL